MPVCPTGAFHKRPEYGIVLVDYDKCIGCEYCSWACPYGGRELEEWHSPLTVASFTLSGIASGFMLVAAYPAWLGNQLVTCYRTWAVVATLLARITRGAATTRNARLKHRSSVQTAIRVRANAVAQ